MKLNQLVRLNGSILSPLLLFPVLWISAALLSQIHLLNMQTGWSWKMTAVVVAVPLAFVAGGLIGSGIGAVVRFDFRRYLGRPTERTIRLLLLIFLTVGFVGLANQFVKIGGIPLIAPDGNQIRFDQGGPSVVLINFLTVAGLIGLVRPRRLLGRESRFELLVALAAIGGFSLQAGRGSIALLIVVAVAARWLYWGRPKLGLLFLAAFAGLALVSFGFYLRARVTPYLPFEAELFGQILPGMPFFVKPLIPIYLAIVTNFYALQGLVDAFPNTYDFGGGTYNAVGLDILFTGASNISDVSGGITPPWVTSTIAGALWADGGFLTVILGSAITGVISVGVFTLAIRTRSLGWCITAAYFLFVTLFGLYTNLWTQQVDWMMVAPLLLILGYVSDAREPLDSVPGSSTTIAAVTPEPDPEPGDSSARFSPAATWALLGVGALTALIVTGLVVQRLLPEPLPAVGNALVPDSVRTAADVMTDGDAPEYTGRLFWLTPSGDGQAMLRTRAPLSDGPGRVLRKIEPPEANDTAFDVANWPPWRGKSLFSFEQRERFVDITVTPSRPGEGESRRFRARVRNPQGQTNDFAIATWQGTRPDLFVISRGSDRELGRLSVFSGESGFRRTVLNERLPFAGLKPALWSLDVGTITQPLNGPESPARPDLILVRHDPDKEYVDVQLMPGERGFKETTYQRDIDLKGSIDPQTGFLLSATNDSPALFTIGATGGGRGLVTVFDLGLMAGAE